jgi:EAL domain-containing protein (putative c-di-GMP-specific phosphodiesterase class I)
MLQEKDIEMLLKRKDKINTQIEIIEKQNEEIKKDIMNKIKELKELGIEITKDNLQEQYGKYNDLVEKQYNELKVEVEKAENELNGL